MAIEISSNDVINWNAKSRIEKKINEVSSICKISKGEIPFKRSLGVSDEYIDRAVTLIKPALINKITAAISDNVSGVDIISVDIINDTTPGEYIVKVVCNIE